MTKVKNKIDTPIVDARPIVAPPFSMTLRAERATKADAAAYGRYIRRHTAPCDMPREYARHAFAGALSKAAMDELKSEVINQVKKGNKENEDGVKFAIASGRTSFDFSKEPSYRKAAEALERAKARLKAVEEKLARQGKGKVKQAPETLRATIA